MGQHAKICRYVPDTTQTAHQICVALTDIIAAALSCFLVLILVGLEITGWKKQKAAEKAQPQSWDRSPPNPPAQSHDPFEAADERNH